MAPEWDRFDQQLTVIRGQFEDVRGFRLADECFDGRDD